MCIKLYQPLGTIPSLGRRSCNLEPSLSCYPLPRLVIVTVCNNSIVNNYSLSINLHEPLELAQKE